MQGDYMLVRALRAAMQQLSSLQYVYCERGGLCPECEAPRVLQDLFSGHEWRRPADVICIPALALVRHLPDGSRVIRAETVCFDFAVINAMGPDH